MTSGKNCFNITKTEWRRGVVVKDLLTRVEMNKVLPPRSNPLILNLYVFSLINCRQA